MKPRTTRMPLPRARLLGILLMGVGAGLANGLLGAGGGILIVYALSAALRESSHDSRDLYANALCIMLPISAFSALRYAGAGNLPIEDFFPYVLPAIIGGLAGGFLLEKLHGSAVKKLFAALVIYSGVFLMIR